MSHPARSRSLALFTAVLLASLTCRSGVARANMAAIQRNPTGVVGPAIARETNLRVDDEQLSFACTEERGYPVCAFEARYTITNPGPTREEAAVVFYGVSTKGIRVTIDGAPAAGTPSPAETAALDAAVAAIRGASGEQPSHREQRATPPVDRAGFLLAAEPGSRHRVVVTGRTLGGKGWVPHDYSTDAVNARHLVVSRQVEEDPMYDIDYLLAPIRTWKGDPRIDVRVTFPSRWHLAIGGWRSPGWAASREGESAVLTRSMTAKEAAVLRMSIVIPAPQLHNGGPLVAAGGTFGPTKAARGRIGYEVAPRPWLFASATADTDFRRRFIVTPLVEAATPAILIIPSFGLGVGVPVQIAPDPRVGARIQGDIHFFPVGFVTSVDLYPRFGSALPGFAEVSLLGQVAF